MNTAHIAQPWCHPVLHSCMGNPEDLEIKLWETVLEQKGLSMDRGAHRRLGYGAKYFDSVVPIEYGNSDRYARQKGQNYKHALDLLTLMESGMSMCKAAKKLGICKQIASRSLKRHRANSACHPELHSSEGNEE